MPGVNLIFPLHNVVNQLNTLIADGTAINKVNSTKKDPRNGFIPDTNMWCAHTRKDRMAIANNDPTIAIYPNIGLRALVLNISDTIPMPGRMIMYTSG